MLPSHIITAIAIARLDLGDTIDQPLPQLIGAATFTGHVASGSVEFALDAAVLSAKDAPEALLMWLNHRLEHDRSTITGYGLAADARLLEVLPLGRWSPAVRVLAGRRQPVIDLGALADGEPIDLRACCEAAGVPCSTPDRVRDFAAWCTGRHDVIVGALELDVIAVWRLTMTQIAARTPSMHRRMRCAMTHCRTRWSAGSKSGCRPPVRCSLASATISATPYAVHRTWSAIPVWQHSCAMTRNGCASCLTRRCAMSRDCRRSACRVCAVQVRTACSSCPRSSSLIPTRPRPG